MLVKDWLSVVGTALNIKVVDGNTWAYGTKESIEENYGDFDLKKGVHYCDSVLCGINGNYAMFELARDSSDIILRKALELAVSDRNYLAEQIYLGAVNGGKLSVDYYIKQAERRLSDEEN